MPVIITASFVYSVYILSRSASSLGQTEIIQAKKISTYIQVQQNLQWLARCDNSLIVSTLPYLPSWLDFQDLPNCLLICKCYIP